MSWRNIARLYATNRLAGLPRRPRYLWTSVAKATPAELISKDAQSIVRVMRCSIVCAPKHSPGGEHLGPRLTCRRPSRSPFAD